MATRLGAWKWTCPHCGGDSMSLKSAKKHLLRKHSACFACHLQRLMVEAMLQGKGFVCGGSESLDSRDS